MSISDVFFVIRWELLIFIIGVASFPFTALLFNSFVDRGYIFSKILGILILTYGIFALGTLHILPFNIVSLVGLGIVFTFLFWFYSFFLDKEKFSWKSFLLLIKQKWFLFFIEELLFFTILLFWSYIRSFQPDIHGLEKYMDFGFINSLLRTEYFPAKDVWFTPFSINYYYFGHIVTAVLTKMSGIPSFITFNIMVATICSFCFSASFSIGINLLISRKKTEEPKFHFPSLKVFFAGILSAFLVTLAGNLHTIYTLFKAYPNESPVPFWELVFSPQTFPNLYWYPNATRFIYHTIHEFPMYSFVVSDLHGHVLDIPIVLCIIALILQGILSKKIIRVGKVLVVLSFLIASAYMTNALDGIIYFGFIGLAVLILNTKVDKAKSIFQNVSIAIWESFIPLLTSILFILIFSSPFSLFFKPFVSGIGILCAPSFLTNIGRVGPFLFEPNHCQHSPFWQLLILYGFFLIWTLAFLTVYINKKRKTTVDLFVLILILLSALLIIVPEFIYFKDIYPAHYRANTMFKLVYQAFILLSLTSGYSIFTTISFIKSSYKHISFSLILSLAFTLLGLAALGLVSLYPYFATTSYYGELRFSHGLNGIKYLEINYPNDYQAILWISSHIKGQPVILEAQGDSYTDYARISANTGLPTVLGWTVHEWLWRGTYDIPAPRISEVQTLYESDNMETTKNILKKYGVQYVFIGSLEREKYLNLNEDKFKKMGTPVYTNGKTVLYKITNL